MRATSNQIELSRRVIALYLLFGTISLVWLAIGVSISARRIYNSRNETSRLMQVGRTSSAIKLALHREVAGGNDIGGKDTDEPDAKLLQQRLLPLLQRLRDKYHFTYCAIADSTGELVATTAPELTSSITKPEGSRETWGDVERIRFVDSSSRLLLEYRSVLRSNNEVLGTLKVGVPEPDAWNTVNAALKTAPLAVVGPLFFLVIGGVVLYRMVTPITGLDRQLRDVALRRDVSLAELNPVKQTSAAALGWNRLVEHWHVQQDHKPLVDRLRDVLENQDQRPSENILQALTDGVAVTDEGGQIEYANRALAALVGEADSLEGQILQQVLNLSEESQAAQTLSDPAGRNRTVVAEMERSTENGTRIFRIARNGMHDQSRRSYLWTLRDITQHRLAEKMRDQFLDSATHELRTPLANIKAYAETLSLSDLNIEQQKEFCNTINAEATRLARFIDDLLSISSMEVGSLSIAPSNVEIERLMADVVTKVRPLMQQKGIHFQESFPPKMPQLKIDKDKFSATLVNLLGNAAKYTPEGGQVALKVKLHQDVLSIDVEDNGPGIAADEQSRIFDKFFRSADPRVQEEVGTGLGLSLAHEVVRLHGGQLTVQSELNKGSTFTISLPIGSGEDRS